MGGNSRNTYFMSYIANKHVKCHFTHLFNYRYVLSFFLIKNLPLLCPPAKFANSPMTLLHTKVKVGCIVWQKSYNMNIL